MTTKTKPRRRTPEELAEYMSNWPCLVCRQPAATQRELFRRGAKRAARLVALCDSCNAEPGINEKSLRLIDQKFKESLR